MYVCLCKGITDKQIKDELQGKGPGQFRDVCSKLGVGKDCGSCLVASEEYFQDMIVAQSKSKQKPFKV